MSSLAVNQGVRNLHCHVWETVVIAPRSTADEAHTDWKMIDAEESWDGWQVESVVSVNSLIEQAK